VQEAQIATSQLIKAREDTAEVLDLVDKAFNQMSLTIQPVVVLTLYVTELMRRDNWNSPTLENETDNLLTRIASVSNDILRPKAPQPIKGFGAIVALTSSQA
jgi:hypothetical protein